MGKARKNEYFKTSFKIFRFLWFKIRIDASDARKHFTFIHAKYEDNSSERRIVPNYSVNFNITFIKLFNK